MREVLKQPQYQPLPVAEQVALLVAVNGGGWGDLLNGEHWLQGSLYTGVPPLQGGPCAINCTNLRGYGFHSFHPAGAQFLMVDASVQFVAETAEAFSVAARITAAKGEVFNTE